MAINVTKDNFEEEVIQSNKPVLIDFWAGWCMPCRMLSPVIDQISNEVDDTKVVKVNIDEEPELAEVFGVMSIPTLALVQDGKVVRTSVGVKPKKAILEMMSV